MGTDYGRVLVTEWTATFPLKSQWSGLSLFPAPTSSSSQLLTPASADLTPSSAIRGHGTQAHTKTHAHQKANGQHTIATP